MADGVVTIWNLTSLKKPERIRILAHSAGSGVTTCKFSECGTLLASGDAQGSCRIFDVRGWNPLNSYALGSAHPIRDRNVKQQLTGHHGPVRALTSLSFSATSSMLATASMDTTVRVWQQSTRKAMSEQDEWACIYCIHLPGPVNFVQFAPNGLEVVANCLNDDRAYAWNLAAMLEQQSRWDYQVIDCGDDRDEIVCTSAAW